VKRLGKCISASILFYLIILSGCSREQTFEKYESPGDKGNTDAKKIRVLTTIAPLYSFTMSVAGDHAIVENLLPSGVGPHEYSMSPEDVIKISKAAVLVKNGVGLENWLNKLTLQDKSVSQAFVDSSSGVKLIDNDPHIWLSPGNVIIQVRNIRDALMKADPVNAESYVKNAEDYIKRLELLDREISKITGRFRKKEFVSLHSAFSYFARDYGLMQVAVIQEFPEKEPTPRHIADVIRAIKENNIRVIFSEPRISHKVVDALAKDLNLQVYNLDTLETGALYPEWYEVRMRANLEVLKMAMNQ